MKNVALSNANAYHTFLPGDTAMRADLGRGFYFGEKRVETAFDRRGTGNLAVAGERAANGEAAGSLQDQRDLAVADVTAYGNRAAVEGVGPNRFGDVRPADDPVVELELHRSRVGNARRSERRLICGDVRRFPDSAVRDHS